MKFSSSPNRPSGWKAMSLGDVCETFTSGGTPSRKRPDFYQNGSIPWVRTKELNDGLVTEVEESITELALKRSSAKRLPAGTVLLAMYGATVGKLGILAQESACNQACAAMVAKRDVADNQFLFYLLKNHRKSIIGQATGAAQQNLSGAQIRNFTFDFPSYDKQKAIGLLLAGFDKQIALNSAIANTLESVAREVFKSWFVDFDPVHAKARGEQPEGMYAETEALFSDSFEDSELGPIPAGWSVGNLSDLVTLVKSTVKAGPATLSKPYVPIDVIRSKSLLLHDVAPSEEAKTSLLSFERGDVLFGAMRPYFHKVCIAPFSGTTRSTNFILRPKSHKVFSALYLSLDETVDFATKHSQGSTIPYAVWVNGLAEMAVVLPPTEVIDSFEELAGPMFELGETLIRENKLLAEIRDSLLPRLISGELEIPEELLGE